MNIITEAKKLLFQLERKTMGVEEAVIPMSIHKSTKDLISRLVDMLEWKPIESIPKGKPVLVVYGARPDVKIGVLSTDEEVWEEDFAYTLAQPTHWMPLPLPPVGDK